MTLRSRQRLRVLSRPLALLALVCVAPKPVMASFRAKKAVSKTRQATPGRNVRSTAVLERSRHKSRLSRALKLGERPTFRRQALFKNPKKVFTKSNLGPTADLHRIAYESLEVALPILKLAQRIERRVFIRHGNPRNRAYHQAFSKELGRKLSVYGLGLVQLGDFSDPSEIATLQARFDNLEAWVDILSHGPGRHGKFTHALQLLVVVAAMRREGYDNKSIQAWYRSMGSGRLPSTSGDASQNKRKSIAVKFPLAIFEEETTPTANRLFPSRDMQAPWPMFFEAFQGQTAPVNLTQLLAEAMSHQFWQGH